MASSFRVVFEIAATFLTNPVCNSTLQVPLAEIIFLEVSWTKIARKLHPVQFSSEETGFVRVFHAYEKSLELQPEAGKTIYQEFIACKNPGSGTFNYTPSGPVNNDPQIRREINYLNIPEK